MEFKGVKKINWYGWWVTTSNIIETDTRLLDKMPPKPFFKPNIHDQSCVRYRLRLCEKGGSCRSLSLSFQLNLALSPENLANLSIYMHGFRSILLLMDFESPRSDGRHV